MENRSINDFMDVTMSKIREITGTDTIVGKPIELPDGSTLIPISKVSFGFGAGVGDYNTKNSSSKGLFGGGTGGGVEVAPVAFLSVRDGVVDVLPVGSSGGGTALSVESAIDALPGIVKKIKDMFDKKKKPDDGQPDEK